jgi:CBS domain-containing protein
MTTQNPSPSLTDAIVENFMSKNVRTVDEDTPLRNCVRLMMEQNIGSVVVLERDTPVGIFTERDLVRLVGGGKENLDAKMRDIMSSSLATIAPTATLWDAISLMGRMDIRRLPVVDKGRLIGILTEKDIMRVLLSQQNLLLEAVAEYLPAMTREQLRTLVDQFGAEKPLR